MKPEAVGLLISGLPLLNPHVGVGVYTRRLIQGLLRQHPAPAFKVLLPTAAAEAAAGIPNEIIIPLGCPSWVRHPLLSNQIWASRIARRAGRDFPRAVFHSPGPIWSPWQPRHTVVTLHDCIYRRFPRYLGRLIARRLLASASERYAARSRLVLTDSQCSATDLQAMAGIPSEKLAVLYPWVDDAFEAGRARAMIPQVRQCYGLPEKFWLYVGGYDYRKNVEFLIKTYATAQSSGPLPPLVLAGRIPERRHATLCDVHGTIQAAGLPAGAILFPGQIPGAELPGLYAAAELLIYPSLYEGFGLPPAEAMAVGTPVLVSDRSSLPEVVPNAGCHFDPGNMPELAAKLSQASHQVERFKCALRPEFRENHAMTRYLEILTRLTGFQQPVS